MKEITQDITVYRFSVEKVLACLRTKVARLNTPALFETTRTLIRTLAKNGFMEDGKEHLLEGAYSLLKDELILKVHSGARICV